MNYALRGFDPDLVEAAPAPATPLQPATLCSEAAADYAALLDHVLARTGIAGTPVLQFLPCQGDGVAPEIARGLALCAAGSLGRTLCVTASHGAAGANGPPGAELATERDPFMPALHHASLPGGIFDRHATEQPVTTWLEAASHAFRLVVIDCAAPRAPGPSPAPAPPWPGRVRFGAAPPPCPPARRPAPLCSGTILLVQAGRTRLAHVQATAAELVQIGGTVLGTVLARVPGRLPRWLRE